MTGHRYRDRVAYYLQSNFGRRGLVVYTEVSLGKTIIGKQRHLDIFVRNESSGLALGLECKYQSASGTTDEKIPYALKDLEAMWIPGCLVYAGEGWSAGVLHTLEGSRNAVFCDPPPDSRRSARTEELDHVVASVFGLWDDVIPSHRLLPDEQLELPSPELQRIGPKTRRRTQRKSG